METKSRSRIIATIALVLAPGLAAAHEARAPVPVFGPGLAAAQEARPPVPPLSGGIQVNEPDHDAWARAVAAAGLDSVQVTLYARQLAWDSAGMILPRDDAAVVSEIRAAHRAGLDVVLVLRTALEHALPENRHLWHGMIWPGGDRVDDWFDAYREFALDGARLAAREGVALLAVGSELNALTSTTPLDGRLPDLYRYYLDPERTGEVRKRLVECAARVEAAALAGDLQYRDGTRYPDLEALLRAEEEATRAWARTVASDRAGVPRPAVLEERRRHHEARWRELLLDVRRVYGGPVTYAANFDQVDQVGFWDALDAVGVNAYYPLGLRGLTGEALRERLESSWRRVASNLQGLARGAGGAAGPLPVVVLELGWTRRAGATVRPYSYTRVEVLETEAGGDATTTSGAATGDSSAGAARGDAGAGAAGVGTGGTGSAAGEPVLTCVHWATQPEAPYERVMALEALLEVVRQGGLPSLRGFTLWKLTTLPEHRSIEPFAVVLPEPGAGAPAGAVEAADRRFLEVAATLARSLRQQAPESTGPAVGGASTETMR